MIWFCGNIYNEDDRELAKKDLGIEPEEMEKKFYDLCTDFELDTDGNIIPAGVTIQCSDF